MFKNFKITLPVLIFITYVNDCVNILQINHLKLITQQKMQNNITIYLFMFRKTLSVYIHDINNKINIFTTQSLTSFLDCIYICTWHQALVQQACPVVPWRTSDWSLHWWLIVSCTRGQSHPRGLAWLSSCELYAP